MMSGTWSPLPFGGQTPLPPLERDPKHTPGPRLEPLPDAIEGALFPRIASPDQEASEDNAAPGAAPGAMPFKFAQKEKKRKSRHASKHQTPRQEGRDIAAEGDSSPPQLMPTRPSPPEHKGGRHRTAKASPPQRMVSPG